MPSDRDTLHHQSWRNEVVSRIQQHRARRGKGGNGGQALEFDFAEEEALIVTDAPLIRHKRTGARFDDFNLQGKDTPATPEAFPPAPPKIIRFPRTASLPIDDPEDERIERSTGDFMEERSPRIVEAAGDAVEQATAQTGPPDLPEQMQPVAQPEQLDLLPSFEDIQLESSHFNPQLESEVIPTPASLAQRLVAGAVDMIVVAAAVVLFDSVFVRFAHHNPHTRMAFLCALCVAGVLWLILQYLFLVHGSGTPGMRFAQLELTTFEGNPVNAKSRRCRALASALSAFSIGLGYAWALVDEDQLGWHDRITGTLVRDSNEQHSTMDIEWG
ncbi:MAG TPA: RDD family protein [Candidatus Angelobacter sp.]|nr:RDD family protein [Candidatus Angelobacter sp.]